MADQYKAPYGDIFYVQTPTLDNWAKQLYVEQKTREARQQQENQALDQMLQKDFGRIRSVDTPDVVNKYNTVKTIKKQLLFDKQLQKDPLAYNQKQQELNTAMQDMYGTINGSAEMKEANKTMNLAHLKNPDSFDDNYGQIMATQMNTPYSQLRNHPVFGDLTNPDTYRYKGANTNFNDIVNKVSTPNEFTGKEESLDKQGIQYRSPVYKTIPPPSQIFSGLVASLDHKTERDAAYKWKQLPPETVQEIEQQYNAIPQSKWEQMGLPGQQPIELKAGGDAEKYMRLLTMQKVINTNPTLSKYSYRTNEKAKMDLQFDRQKQMEALKHADAKDLINYKKQIDPNDTDLNNLWVDQYISKLKEDAYKKPTLDYKYANGSISKEYDIPIDPVIGQALSVGGIQPDAFRVDKDGNFRRIFFDRYEKGETLPAGKQVGDIKLVGGKTTVDETLSRPKLTQQQIELALGKKALTGKQLNKQMTANTKIASSNGKKYNYNGQTYTHDQLNKMGYDDDTINQAIQQGLMK